MKYSFLVRSFLFVLAAVITPLNYAMAEGFALYEYSSRGVALGGAMVARKPDASAIAYNPALITKLDGTHIMSGVSSIAPKGRMKGTTDRGEDFSVKLKDSIWAIPHFYLTQKITDKVTVGVGEFSRFGLGFEYPHNWAGRQNVYQVELSSVSVNPNVAVAVTDALSLAGGIEFVYVNLGMKKRSLHNLPFGNSQMEVDHNIVNAEDVGTGFNLAAHYQFSDEWAAGLSYRSQVKVTAHGEMQNTFVNKDSLASRLPAPAMAAVNNSFNSRFEDGRARGKVVLPDSLAGGVSWSPVPELSVEVGAVWTRWSNFKSLDIQLPVQDTIAKSKKEWKDSWRFNIGAEYDVLDWLTLRAGYVHDRSPMTNEYADYLIPTDGRNIYSAGFGLNWDSWTLDFSYAYIDAKGRRYSRMYLGENAAGQDVYVDQKSKVTKSSTDIYSLSIGYSF